MHIDVVLESLSKTSQQHRGGSNTYKGHSILTALLLHHAIALSWNLEFSHGTQTRIRKTTQPEIVELRVWDGTVWLVLAH